MFKQGDKIVSKLDRYGVPYFDGVQTVLGLDPNGFIKVNSTTAYNPDCVELYTPSQGNSTERKGKKLQYHLVPPKQLEDIAKIMQRGEETHDEPYMDIDPILYFDAAFRHLMAIRNGELIDEEDGFSHALHLACNGMILDRQLRAGKKLDFGGEE